MLTTVCTVMIYMLISVLLALCFSLFAVFAFCAGPYFVLLVKESIEEWVYEDRARREKIKHDDDYYFTNLVRDQKAGVLSEF